MKESTAIQYNREWNPEGTHEHYRWVEYPEDGLRFLGDVHKIRGTGEGNQPYFDRSPIDHTGWFINSSQDETVCGQVYQLPTRGGKSVYVPACSDAFGNPGALLDFRSTTDDLYDAIHWADSMAEHYAEREREYQAKESAAMRIEDIGAEIKTLRSDALVLIRELRSNCDALTGMLALRATIREHIRRVRAECAKLAAERDEIEENGLPELY